MPKIERFISSGNLRLGGAGVRNAGVVGEAAAGLARQVGGLATDAIQKQNDADNVAFVSEQTNRLLRQESERLADTETTGADVDLEGLQSGYQDRVSAMAENAPSEEARAEFNRNADGAFTRKFFPGYTQHQSKQNINRRINSTESALDDITSEVLTGRTDVPEALGRAEAVIAGLAETSGGAVDVGGLREKTKNAIGKNALTSQIESDPHSALEEMNAGDWDSVTSTGDLAILRRQAKQKIDQGIAAGKQKLQTGANNYMAFLSSGAPDSEELQAQFSDEALNETFGEKGPGISEAITDAREFGAAVNEIKVASPQELSSLLSSSKPKTIDKFTRESAQFAALNRAISARNKQIAASPSAYAVENSPEVSQSFEDFSEAINSNDPAAIQEATEDYTAESRAFQESLGVHSDGVQFLPKQMESAIGKQLNDFSQGGENVAIQVNALKDGFGQEWGAVRSQLQQSGNLSAGSNVMLEMEFGAEQIALAEALSIGQAGYKEVLPADDVKDIKANSLEATEEFNETLRAQPGAEKIIAQHRAAIETLAMKYLSDGVDSDSDDAIERATDDIINKRFSFVDSYRVPTTQSADLVENGVDAAISDIKSGGFDLLIPESSRIANEEDRKSVFLSVLRPRAVTSPKGDGIIFMHDNNAILTSDGKALIIPWERLENTQAVDEFVTLPRLKGI